MVDQKPKYKTVRLPNGQEIKASLLSKEDVEKRIAKFEAKYGMTSHEFIGKWKRGELECIDDYFRWEAYFRVVFKQAHAELEVED